MRRWRRDAEARDSRDAGDPYGLAEEAAESIGGTLDALTTCAELARFVCRQVADAAAVDLWAQDASERRPPPGPARGRTVAAGGADLLDPRPPPGPRAVSVPLAAHGRLYGSLLAVRAVSLPPFAVRDTALLRYAARLAAVHIGHAREHTAAHATALNLQRALLADPVRPHPNLDIATRYLPAGGGSLVGGDWFETVRLSFGRSLLVIGDVMGHGLDAAVDMNAYRSMLRYVASADLPPHRVLRQLDAAVAEDGTRRPATCLLVRVDPTRGAASLASAGHLPPVLFSGDGTGRLLHLPVGPPLGTGVGGYEPTARRLAPDETLVMFTDGLVERRKEDIDVSLARLADLRLPPGAGIQDLLDEILTRLDVSDAEDDVAVLAARIRQRPAVR